MKHMWMYSENNKKSRSRLSDSLPYLQKLTVTLARTDIRLAWGFQNFMQNTGNTQPI